MSKKYYECFSERQHGFLIYKGFKEVRNYKHNKTGVICHVYKITPELEVVLKLWSETKPSSN